MLQPPFHVKKMVGESYRGLLVPTVPGYISAGACEDGVFFESKCSLVDLVLLKPASHEPSNGMVIRALSTFNSSQDIVLEVVSSTVAADRDLTLGTLARACNWHCETLACGLNASTANTMDAPDKCVPKALPNEASIKQGTNVAGLGTELRMTIPAKSFTTCTHLCY